MKLLPQTNYTQSQAQQVDAVFRWGRPCVIAGDVVGELTSPTKYNNWASCVALMPTTRHKNAHAWHRWVNSIHLIVAICVAYNRRGLSTQINSPYYRVLCYVLFYCVLKIIAKVLVLRDFNNTQPRVRKIYTHFISHNSIAMWCVE